MIAREPILQVAGTWGIDQHAAVSMVHGERITAVRWRHNLPELNDTTLPHNTLVFLLRPGRSYRHRGARVEAACSAYGDMGLVPMGADGAWSFEAPVDVLHLYIPQTTLDDLADSLELPAFQLHDRFQLQDPVLRAMAGEIASSMHEGPSDRLYVDALGTAMAMRVVRQHSSLVRQREISRGGLTPRQVRRVTDYLQAHLEEDVSLSELAGLVDLSPAYLCRAFKQSVGVPPHAWLLRHRVERAQEMMLAFPEMGLTEVALSVGYSGQSAFGTAFRRVTGETPSAWKRERLT